MGNTRDTGYLRNLVSYDASGNIALPGNLNVAGIISGSVAGVVPTGRTLTINGTTYDLSADRSWTIPAGVTSFNTRTGAITLVSTDVTSALGFSPYNATNPSGYITSSGSITGSAASLALSSATITSSSWAGGSGYHGYSYTGGNWRFGFSSSSGAVDVYADGNFYATDNSYLVYHTGNISGASVNYATTSGTASSANSVNGKLVGNSANNLAYYDANGNLYVNNPESYSGEVRLGAAWGYGGVYASNGLSLGTSGSFMNFVFSNAIPTTMNSSGAITFNNYNTGGIRVTSSGTGSAGAAFAIQQVTSEGWTGVFVDFEPNTGWGLYHDNPNNYFCITSETSTGGLRSFTVPSRSSGNRTAYEKIRFDQTNGYITAGGDITAFSDGRVKTEVKVIDNAIEKIKAIRGVTFLRTDSEGEYKDKRYAGVIAQEVLEVLPEVVNKDKNTGMYSVSYGNMGGLFIEGFKEHDQVIKAQGEQLKAQAEEIKELKRIINGFTN